MRFGVEVPTCRELRPYPRGFSTPQSIRSMALAVEELGYYSIWSNDHLVTPRGEVTDPDLAPNYYEPFVTFAYIAGITTRVRLATATIVTPLRQPVLLAKQVATLDQLSGGRLILGLGLGSVREEFELLATNPKASRGNIQIEFIDAIRLLLNTHHGSFEGRYFRFGDIVMKPAPAQQPFPIYLSATVPEALERVGAVAHGWIEAAVAPAVFRERIQVVRSAAERAGRDPSGIEICLIANVAIDETEEGARAVHEGAGDMRGGRRRAAAAGASTTAASPFQGGGPLVGTPAQIAGRLEEYREAGVEHVGMILEARTPEELIERAGLFARDVMPQFAP